MKYFSVMIMSDSLTTFVFLASILLQQLPVIVAGQLIGFAPTQPGATQAAQTVQANDNDACQVVYIDDPLNTPIDPANNGKLVFFHAPLTFEQGAIDPIFGACAHHDPATNDNDEFSLQCLSMFRSVQMYLWEEEKTCDPNCVVSYSQKWIRLNDNDLDDLTCNTCERDSDAFEEPEGHQNPDSSSWNITSAQFQATNVTIGPFFVAPNLGHPGVGGPNGHIMRKDRIPATTKQALHEAGYAIGQNSFGEWYLRYEEGDDSGNSTNATDTDNQSNGYQPGDVKIDYTSLFALTQNPAHNLTAGAMFSVLAMQLDEQTLAPYDLNCDSVNDATCTTHSLDLIVNVYQPGVLSLDDMTSNLRADVLPASVFCLVNGTSGDDDDDDDDDDDNINNNNTASEITTPSTGATGGTGAATTTAATTTSEEDDDDDDDMDDFPPVASAPSPVTSPVAVLSPTPQPTQQPQAQVEPTKQPQYHHNQPTYNNPGYNNQEEPAGDNSLLSSAESVLTLIVVAAGVVGILYCCYRRNFGGNRRQRTQYNQAAMSAIDEFENDIEMRPID